MDFTRPLLRGEEEAVHGLLCAAFETDAEAQLVRKLRKGRVMAGEMVLPLEEQIAGYYALSYMVAPKGWLALAPVAIHPDVQRQKLGKRMLGMLTEWARLTKTPVVVLGSPTFYEKTGFASAAAARLTSPYGVDHTLLAGVTGTPEVTLIYPDAFNGL